MQESSILRNSLISYENSTIMIIIIIKRTSGFLKLNLPVLPLHRFTFTKMNEMVHPLKDSTHYEHFEIKVPIILYY